MSGPDLAAAVLLAGQQAERLPPTVRAIALMALLALIVLALFYTVLVLLGGHWVRRLGGHRRGPAVPPDQRPLRPAAADDDYQTLPESVDDDTVSDVARRRTKHD